MKAALILAALIAGHANAGYVYRTDGLTLNLQDRPCAHQQVLDLLRDEYKDKFSHGIAMVSGKPVNLCWIETEGQVVIIDEDGSGGAIPVGSFKKVSSV